MISDAIALLDLVRKIYGTYQDKKILSAVFGWDARRLEGDERIKVNFHDAGKNEGGGTLWIYSIEPFEDYLFIRIPVHAGGVQEALGSLKGETNADARYFRYIALPDGRLFGGSLPNVKVSFLVYAYKPSDLLSLGKGNLQT